jgi:alpha-1,6-mannosyltransferase
MRIGKLVRHPTFQYLLLVLIWLASYLIYYLMLVRPYWLYAYLWTPKLSTGVIANREHGPAAAFILGFALLFGLYAAAYQICKRSRSTDLITAVGLCGLILAILLTQVYPIGANDMFGYITAGELLAFHNLNPMVYPASHVPNLPLAEYSAYARTAPNYGPVWTWIEAAVVGIVGRPDLLRLTLGFKAVAVVAYAATAAVLLVLLRRRAPDRMAAGLLAFAWNPLVLFEVGVNAHNDIWIGLLILLGVLFWEMRRPVWLLAALTLAALIKLPVVALLPLFFLAAWRLAPSARGRWRLLWSSGLVVAGIVAISYLSLPEGLKGLANLQGRTDLFTDSLPAIVKLLLALALPQETAMLLAGLATLLAFGGYIIVQLANVWLNPKDAVRLAFNILLFLLLACMSWFQPWYLIWIVPLAAIYPRPNAPFQVGLFTLCASWSYIVFGFVWFWIVSIGSWGKGLGIESIAVTGTYALSWVYAILSGLRDKRHKHAVS